MGEGIHEDQPFEGELPHAQDRLWRHPAERGAQQAAANLEARRVHGRRWPAMVMSFIAGGTFVGLIWLLQAQTQAPIEQNVSNVVEAPTPETVLGPLRFEDWISEVIEINHSSVVGLYLGGEAAEQRAHAVRLGTDGHLITSAHALAGARDIRVVLPSGSDTLAQIVALDAVSGIGVLKINAPDLPPPTFSRSDDVVLSDRLVALAHHSDGLDSYARAVTVLGEDQVVAAQNGDLLSGLIRLSNDLESGWSGAAVLEEDGGIVAITTQSRSGNHYAIPISKAREVARQLIDNGAVKYKAWLGVEMVDLSEGIKDQRELLGGVLMRRVWDQTPAAQGGLVAGDIIIGIDDANILDKTDLQLYLGTRAPGDVIEVRYSRVTSRPAETEVSVDEPAPFAGEMYTTTVTVGARPA